jgi:hypothetical protein
VKSLQPNTIRDAFVAVIRYDNLILAILAVGIGVVVGWSVVGFRTVIDLVQTVFYG